MARREGLGTALTFPLLHHAQVRLRPVHTERPQVAVLRQVQVLECAGRAALVQVVVGHGCVDGK